MVEQGGPATAPRLPRIVRLCRSAARRPLDRLTVAAAAIAGSAVSLALAPDARGLLGAALAVLAVLIAAVDARYFIIPNELTAAALALGLCSAAAREPDMLPEALFAAAARGLVLAALFWAVRAGYGWLRRREGIGLGDVKLAGVAGVWLSWSTIPLTIEVAAAAALATVLARQWLLGEQIRAVSRLPFGLFLAPSIWLGWLLDVAPVTRSWF